VKGKKRFGVAAGSHAVLAAAGAGLRQFLLQPLKSTIFGRD
jgi:hypothetical protein